LDARRNACRIYTGTPVGSSSLGCSKMRREVIIVGRIDLISCPIVKFIICVLDV